MKGFSLLLASLVALAPLPALAEVSTYDGTDRKLYVRQVSSEIATASLDWDKKGGAGRSFQGVVRQDVIYRGDVAISDARFLEVLADAGVAAGLRERVEMRIRGAANTSLAGLAMLGAGGYLAYLDMNRKSSTPSNPVYLVGGISLLTVGTLFAVGAGQVIQQRQFSTEEAIDAAEEYNQKIERR